MIGKFILFVILMVIMDPIDAQSTGRVDKGIFYSVIDIDNNGSGFIVSRNRPDGTRQFFLVTNKHMIGDWSMVDPFVPKPKVNIYLYTNDRKNPTKRCEVNIIENSNLSSKVKVHPNNKIDISVIDITELIYSNNLSNELNLWSIDTSYLLPLNKINSSAFSGIGDQVYAIGYPAGFRSSKTNEPILKVGYISSSLDGDLEILFPWTDKKGVQKKVSADGKFFLVDGLIIGGNSGGPIVNPKGVKSRVVDGQFQHTTIEIPNYIFGIVSFGLPGTGISTVYGCDHIFELINSF